MLNALILMMFFFSCNKEELIEQNIENVVIEEDKNSDTVNEDADDTNEPESTDPSLPCAFALKDLIINDSININCVLDLEGQAVNLPANVTLKFDGGQIINGILNFAGGQIDGKLLNDSLKIHGDVMLIDETFFFSPEKWNIVEGKVTDEIALNNKNIINEVIKLVYDLGGKVFEMDKINAYFDVRVFLVNQEKQALNSILIPSNFEVKMSDNTHLRVQPNEAPAYHLMSIFKGENIKISGGNLYGDRWEHDYSPVNDIYGNNRDTHDWGHVLKVSGGKNVLIENVYMTDATGDAFGINASTIRNTDGSPGGAVISENVTIRNCILNESRRNNISLTDCNGVLIEDNEIKNTGLGEKSPNGYSSAGVAPKYGIDLEAWRVRTDTGELLEYERNENVIIRGNTFTNNKAGDILLFTCYNVIIENNYFDSMIGNKAAHDITIRNNEFKARIGDDGEPFEYAIIINRLSDPMGQEFNFNYKISGNKISGYRNGLVLSGEKFVVSNNIIENCKSGIGLGHLKNSQFYDNHLNSEVVNSFGYFTRGGVMNDVSVKNEYVEVTRRSIDFYNIEADESNPLVIDNCIFVSTENKNSNIDNSQNIIVKNSSLNTEIDIVNSLNIQLINNE